MSNYPLFDQKTGQFGRYAKYQSGQSKRSDSYYEQENQYGYKYQYNNMTAIEPNMPKMATLKIDIDKMQVIDLPPQPLTSLTHMINMNINTNNTNTNTDQENISDFKDPPRDFTYSMASFSSPLWQPQVNKHEYLMNLSPSRVLTNSNYLNIQHNLNNTTTGASTTSVSGLGIANSGINGNQYLITQSLGTNMDMVMCSKKENAPIKGGNHTSLKENIKARIFNEMQKEASSTCTGSGIGTITNAKPKPIPQKSEKTPNENLYIKTSELLRNHPYPHNNIPTINMNNTITSAFMSGFIKPNEPTTSTTGTGILTSTTLVPAGTITPFTTIATITPTTIATIPPTSTTTSTLTTTSTTTTPAITPGTTSTSTINKPATLNKQQTQKPIAQKTSFHQPNLNNTLIIKPFDSPNRIKGNGSRNEGRTRSISPQLTPLIQNIHDTTIPNFININRIGSKNKGIYSNNKNNMNNTSVISGKNTTKNNRSISQMKPTPKLNQSHEQNQGIFMQNIEQNYVLQTNPKSTLSRNPNEKSCQNIASVTISIPNVLEASRKSNMITYPTKSKDLQQTMTTNTTNTTINTPNMTPNTTTNTMYSRKNSNNTGLLSPSKGGVQVTNNLLKKTLRPIFDGGLTEKQISEMKNNLLGCYDLLIERDISNTKVLENLKANFNVFMQEFMKNYKLIKDFNKTQEYHHIELDKLRKDKEILEDQIEYLKSENQCLLNKLENEYNNHHYSNDIQNHKMSTDEKVYDSFDIVNGIVSKSIKEEKLSPSYTELIKQIDELKSIIQNQQDMLDLMKNREQKYLTILNAIKQSGIDIDRLYQNHCIRSNAASNSSSSNSSNGSDSCYYQSKLGNILEKDLSTHNHKERFNQNYMVYENNQLITCDTQLVTCNTQQEGWNNKNERFINNRDDLPDTCNDLHEIRHDFLKTRNDHSEMRKDLFEAGNDLPEAHNDLSHTHNGLSETRNDLPEIGNKSLEAQNKLPEILDESPEIKYESPKIRYDLQKTHNDLPKTHNELPDVQDELPKILSKLPEILSKSPEILFKPLEILSEPSKVPSNLSKTLTNSLNNPNNAYLNRHSKFNNHILPYENPQNNNTNEYIDPTITTTNNNNNNNNSKDHITTQDRLADNPDEILIPHTNSIYIPNLQYPNDDQPNIDCLIMDIPSIKDEPCCSNEDKVNNDQDNDHEDNEDDEDDGLDLFLTTNTTTIVNVKNIPNQHHEELDELRNESKTHENEALMRSSTRLINSQEGKIVDGNQVDNLEMMTMMMMIPQSKLGKLEYDFGNLVNHEDNDNNHPQEGFNKQKGLQES